MGVKVTQAMYSLINIHRMIESGNLSYFDLAAAAYHYAMFQASESERANTESWHPYWTVDYFRRCLWAAHTALLDNVITAADLDEVSPILDEINEELDMIGIWEELVDEFIINDCDFANFTSNLASYYEDCEC